jgi:hypothetical protein
MTIITQQHTNSNTTRIFLFRKFITVNREYIRYALTMTSHADPVRTALNKMSKEPPKFTIHSIVDQMLDTSGRRLVKVRWDGYLPIDDTWEFTANVTNDVGGNHVVAKLMEVHRNTVKMDNSWAAAIKKEVLEADSTTSGSNSDDEPKPKSKSKPKPKPKPKPKKRKRVQPTTDSDEEDDKPKSESNPKSEKKRRRVQPTSDSDSD